MLKLEYIVCIFCLGSFCRWLELALQQMLDCSIDLFFLFLRKTSEMTEDVFITNATNNFVVAVVCSKVNWVLILWVLVPVCCEMHTYSTSREIWLFFFFWQLFVSSCSSDLQSYRWIFVLFLFLHEVLGCGEIFAF